MYTPISNLTDPAASPAQWRAAFRAGAKAAHTSGLADRHVQGNVVILPRDWAGDFLRYCQRNPKPCPLLAVGDAGHPALPGLGQDIDIRTDLPRYRIWRDGQLGRCTGSGAAGQAGQRGPPLV